MILDQALPARRVRINVFERVDSKRPRSKDAWPDDIARLMVREVRQVARKDAAPLLTFNEYREGATSRGTADIVSAHAVCGDIDEFDAAKFEAGLAELERAGAQVIAHQTYSHTPESPRWRVFVFLDEPVSVADYAACWRGLNDVFGGILDSNAKDCARINYWPSCPPGQTREVRTLNMEAVQ
jgi:hypothetical protein